MPSPLFRILAFTTGLVATAMASASPPIVIDSEQKAVAAFVSAFRLKTEPANDLNFVTSMARSRAEDGLRQLALATTPADLLNARSGITLPCDGGGHLTARMARSYPRVLRLNWEACKFTDENGNAHERVGSLEIVLLSDTFTPERIAGLRLGTTTADFVEQRLIRSDRQITDEARSYNLKIVGSIPMKRTVPQYGAFVGEFAFQVTGFINIHAFIDLLDTGEPRFESNERTQMEFVFATGATTHDDMKGHDAEDTWLHLGQVTRSHYETRFPGRPEVTTQYSLAGLRTRKETDFVDFEHAWTKESIDGRIDYRYANEPPYTDGCQSGSYTFRTRVPIAHNIFGPGVYDAGDVLINASTRVQIFTAANVPAGLPVPLNNNLVHFDVKNLGTFDYDVNGLQAVTQIAQCY